MLEGTDLFKGLFKGLNAHMCCKCFAAGAVSTCH